MPVFARLQSDRAAQLVPTAGASVVGVRAVGAAAGGGSGVALGADRVLTSAHSSRAPRLTVTTSQGRVLPATIAGVDPETDLALLRVDDGRLPRGPARLGRRPRVGQLGRRGGCRGGERRWAGQGVVSGVGVLVTGDGTAMPGMV